MHPRVAQEAIDAYREVGVAHVPGVFSQEWVARMTRGIDSVVPGRGAAAPEITGTRFGGCFTLLRRA